jgi:hypothetical protein
MRTLPYEWINIVFFSPCGSGFIFTGLGSLCLVLFLALSTSAMGQCSKRALLMCWPLNLGVLALYNYNKKICLL